MRVLFSYLVTYLEAPSQQGRCPPFIKWLVVSALDFSMIFAGLSIVLEFNKSTVTIQSRVDNVPIRILQGVELVERLTLTRSCITLGIAADNEIVDGEQLAPFYWRRIDDFRRTAADVDRLLINRRALIAQKMFWGIQMCVTM